MKDLKQMSRQELYGLVWSEALSTLAPKLGISDVGLKKHCRKHGVPTPPRGYWAKLAAGKKARQTPLPDTWQPIAKRKKKVPQSQEEIQRYSPPQESYAVAKPHQLVKETKRALAPLRWRDDGLLHAGGAGCLETDVSRDQKERALWLWNEVIPLFEQVGLTIHAESKSAVRLNDTDLRIRIKEKLTAYQMKRDERIPSHRWIVGDTVTEKAPNGILAIQIQRDTGGFESWREWKDTATIPLNDRIRQIPEAVCQIFETLRLKAIERKKQAAIWAEEERQRRLAEERARKEKEKRQQLIKMAEAHESAERIRRFIEVVASTGQPTEAQSQFVAWAQCVAEEIDAVQEVCAELDENLDPFRERTQTIASMLGSSRSRW